MIPNIENLLALQEVTEFTYNAQRDGDADKAERAPAAAHQPEHHQGIN
ncbi:hypothetical protein EAE_04135 [Klebsiella aerogenes KCTC 2190]|uniref:Uncharacterized protein n=1 Tax=Klebsiella aerogenes (strain ATCC 13048 / DSM 30053 / CCUG 1429 / JCM 1235 / KCTC 2190 / NBRC 13534 / NCIMB 10102 / NCTC 10006 / CDC 819-56) TaxID=1028307 RepID=A0A0H3FMT3_KLEAK|nr:hypothetical protein EAE_04135 [Klebsiella aerogenes KCTC 2190]